MLGLKEFLQYIMHALPKIGPKSPTHNNGKHLSSLIFQLAPFLYNTIQYSLFSEGDVITQWVKNLISITWKNLGSYMRVLLQHLLCIRLNRVQRKWFSCHSGKLKLAYTSPNVISTSPENILMSRIDFTVLL